jgi:hypothetical protein
MKIGWSRRIGRPSSTLWQLSETVERFGGSY